MECSACRHETACGALRCGSCLHGGSGCVAGKQMPPGTLAGNEKRLAPAIGGVFFLISDTILAYGRFRWIIPGQSLWVLGSYYIAQWLFARSTCAVSRAGNISRPSRIQKTASPAGNPSDADDRGVICQVVKVEIEPHELRVRGPQVRVRPDVSLAPTPDLPRVWLLTHISPTSGRKLARECCTRNATKSSTEASPLSQPPE